MRKCVKISAIMGICLTIIIVGVCVGIICPRICDDLQEREFEIFQSYNFISGEYRDAIIKVIINVDKHNTENVFDKIRVFYNKLNGEADKLEIYLYNSKDDIKLGNCVGSKTYYKD